MHVRVCIFLILLYAHYCIKNIVSLFLSCPLSHSHSLSLVFSFDFTNITHICKVYIYIYCCLSMFFCICLIQYLFFFLQKKYEQQIIKQITGSLGVSMHEWCAMMLTNAEYLRIANEKMIAMTTTAAATTKITVAKPMKRERGLDEKKYRFGQLFPPHIHSWSSLARTNSTIFFLIFHISFKLNSSLRIATIE